MSKFLLLSVIRSDFSKMIHLAKLLRNNGHDVAFYFEQRWHNLYQSIDEANAEGFTVFGKRIEPKQETKRKAPQAKSQSVVMRIPVFFKRVIFEIKSLRTLRRNFTQVVKDYRPNALIMPACSAGYNIPVYASLSRELKLRTICIPFAIGDKDAAQKAIRFAPKSSPDYLLNSRFKSFFGKWYLIFNGEYYPVLSAEMLVAYKLHAIDVTFPLSFYGVRVDQLLLENEFMLAHASGQSLDAGSVDVTGSIFDDDLAVARKERVNRYKQLCERFSWDASRRMICIALPPLVNDKDSNSRFFDFDVLMEKFLPSACDFSSINVLVSLHPRINLELIKSYRCPDNLRLIGEPVEVFIPMCDVFISTYSSTIRTAVALRIPVINYDILNFDYELFRDVAGIAYTPDESHYCDVLRDCISEGEKYQELTDQLRTSNLLSSTLDGRSKQRILKAITRQS
jgi:hypothetical protein